MPFFFCCSVSAYAQTPEQWKAISSDFQPASQKSIDALIRRIGDKRVVAIGEETHGTGDYQDFRNALTRRLVEKQGFTMVILENPHEDMVKLQADLGKVPLDTLMRRHLFEIYQTAEMKAFLEWVMAYTQKGKTLRLGGCDDSNRDVLPLMIKERLAKYDNAALNALLDDYIQRAMLHPTAYWALPGKQRVINSGRNVLVDMMWESLDVALRIDSIYKTLPAKDPLVEELLFHLQGGLAQGPSVIKNRWVLSRDSMMAARVNYHSNVQGAKVVVWAHNAHVAKKPVIDDVGRMGEEIGIANPGRFFSIGLNCGEGTYTYINTRAINADHRFRDSTFNKALLPLKPESWNAAMQQQTKRPTLFDFSRLQPAERSVFLEPKLYRFVGYNAEKNADGSYFKTAPALLYDAVIYYPVTHHTKHLF